MSKALAAHPAEGMVLAEGEPPMNGEHAPEGPGSGQAELIALLPELAGAPSGLDVLYRALAVTATRYQLSDLMVVLDHETTGRQLFRLERRPIGPDDLEWLTLERPLVAVPDRVPDDVAVTLLAVADAAFANELARHQQLRDPLSALLTRAVFNESLRAAAAQSSRYGWTFTVALVQVGEGEELEAAQVRHLGHAFGRALRSGDTGSRLQWSTFAALLPNATAEALHAFVRRFAEESGVEEAALRVASATAPNESVDPAELFRLAGARLRQ